MSPVLGKKTLRGILEVLESAAEQGPAAHVMEMDRLLAEVRAALKPTKATRFKVQCRREKATKKASKFVETKAIRAAVFERSGGFCECGCGKLGEQLDHARGRARAKQSAENTWLLSTRCHELRTNGSRNEWLRRYSWHSKRHGHHVEAAWAERELGWANAKATARSELGKSAAP